MEAHNRILYPPLYRPSTTAVNLRSSAAIHLCAHTRGRRQQINPFVDKSDNPAAWSGIVWPIVCSASASSASMSSQCLPCLFAGAVAVGVAWRGVEEGSEGRQLPLPTLRRHRGWIDSRTQSFGGVGAPRGGLRPSPPTIAPRLR